MSNNNSFTGLSLRDIVNLSAFISLDKALNLHFTKVIARKARQFGIIHDVYSIGPIDIVTSWPECMYDGLAPSPVGEWRDTQSNFYGKDIISLGLHITKILSLPPKILPLPSPERLHVSSPEFLQEAAARFRPEATEQSIVDDFAGRLGIDIREPKIKQSAALRGWSQVNWASRLSPILGETNLDNGLDRTWPNYRLDRVPYIGTPTKKFEIRDALGRVQQIIGLWHTAWGKPLLLSFTLWQNDKDPLNQMWKFARSAIKTCPFGLSWALTHPDATVVIDDDLYTVDSENARLYKYHGAASSIIFVAWPRGLYAATPAGTDWSQLRGRKVLVAVSNDRDSFVHALELNDELQKVGTDSHEFILPTKAVGGADEISVDYKGSDIRGVRKNAFEFAELAEQKFGILSKIIQTTALPPVWKIGDDLSSSETELILVPGIERRTVNLIYASPGVGKSWFILHILYALATGEKLWGRFHAPKKLRCLYLAGESAGKMCKRLQEIHAAMNGGDTEIDIDIEVYPRPGENIGRLNLETEEAWEKIKKQVEKADVIAIDHLIAFTSKNFGPHSWSRVNSHFCRLTQLGKTILVVHHAGKDGNQLGTIVRDIDVDLKIRIERLPNASNGLRIVFEKNRDDLTLGKALQAFHLFYERGANGQNQWWTVDPEAADMKTWVSQPHASNDSIRSFDETFIRATFCGREADIIHCLATAIIKGKPGLLRQEIDDQTGASGSTTRSVITDLVTKGSVVVEGKGKATRYALSDKLKKIIIRE